MDDKLFMIWFVVSFAFSNQTGPDQATPFWGLGLGRPAPVSFEQFVVIEPGRYYGSVFFFKRHRSVFLNTTDL